MVMHPPNPLNGWIKCPNKTIWQQQEGLSEPPTDSLNQPRKPSHGTHFPNLQGVVVMMVTKQKQTLFISPIDPLFNLNVLRKTIFTSLIQKEEVEKR